MMEYTKNLPLISIILPVCNESKSLSDCLQSLLNQTYRNFEVIAIDDNSKDNSLQILKKYCKKDKRIRIFKNIKRYGKAVTLNRALKRAKGYFIAFMNAKDKNHSERLKKQFEYLQEHKKTVAVGCQYMLFDQNNHIIGKSDFPTQHNSIYQKPLNDISLLFQNIMINKFRIPKDILSFKAHKEPFFYSDMIVKLLRYGEITNLSQALYFHRKEAKNAYVPISKHIASFIKVWIRAIAFLEHRPSLRYLFFPSVKTKVA